MATIPNQNDPTQRGTLPLRVIDSTLTPVPGTPAPGPSGDGADARTPEACKCDGYSTGVPMPSNVGPTTHGSGPGLPQHEGHGK